MVLFEMSPFHPFYHSPAASRRGCRRGMPGNNCMWSGHPALDLALQNIHSRSSNVANFNNSKLKQEVTEEGVRFSLPLEGFDMSNLEVKIEDGVLKIKGKREEKNDKGETVSSRMMKQIVSLPKGCDTEGMETSFEQEGVLAISIPRRAKPLETQVETQVETQEATQETQETQEIQKAQDTHMTAEETPSDRILATIPVRGFRPEELTVKVTNDGRSLEVSGRHEHESGYVSQFARVYPLFRWNVEVDEIQSRLVKDGAELTITAPAPVLQPAAEAEVEKNIPIQMED